MSLFGTSPPGDAAPANSTLFDDDRDTEPTSMPTKSTSDSLFADDDFSGGAESPWDMPTPRKQLSRVEVIRNLLPATNVPDSYVDAFDIVMRDDGTSGRINTSGIARTLAAARLSSQDQARVIGIVAPEGATTLGRGEFNVFLALIALAQEGPNQISLDTVDERRRHLPEPLLSGLTTTTANNNTTTSTFSIPARAELAAKPPQRPTTPPRSSYKPTPSNHSKASSRPSMDYSADPDPWNTPDVHRDHNHTDSSSAPRNTAPSKPNGSAPPAPRRDSASVPAASDRNSYMDDALMSPSVQPPVRTTSDFTTASEFTTAAAGSGAAPPRQSNNSLSSPSGGGGEWVGYYDGGFGDGSVNPNPFGGTGGGNGSGDRDRESGGNPPGPSATRTIGCGRTGAAIEENIVVTLMPEKEGIFLFQHHNYEVTSARRGSKVIRRYSDFVWLLDCLHKRYPFRALPLLPPKRVAVNGNHLSNDGAFIEKRRRGLARFLNSLVRHPVLSQEQLVIMFLTVPTELAVWRKQATISVQDEFQGRDLPADLEDSLPPNVEELFARTRMGIRRSSELYIGVCNIMDRLVKRSEGVAADHARLALSLMSLTELSNETYATDTNDVPLLNDGLVSMAKHLRTTQSLMEDESKAWEQGVLEDLKRQRDALVGVRDMFDRRERHDRDSISQLERQIAKNEAKLEDLQSKPDGTVKPGEVGRVAQLIVADKESIVEQHNRGIFVKECIRDELLFFQTTQYHVSHWNQDWAQERVKYSEMLADNWRRLLDELDGMPLGN
ncbi:Sorting nexin mvp1 [Zalerion maritima]|uniref:Sorting nexin MVP1 n=1 Tax=Zalerion maritima TaxID=339359 RepID=A0AAD5RWM2_9PEZI|nr:Sorting nexin mvp1 [Zalerion maritima]